MHVVFGLYKMHYSGCQLLPTVNKKKNSATEVLMKAFTLLLVLPTAFVATTTLKVSTCWEAITIYLQ